VYKSLIETKTTCPLGGECEVVKDGAIERCAWYVELSGTNPQTGEQIHNVSRCAMNWLPILLVEGNGKTLHVAAAVESLRNTVAEPRPIRIVSDYEEPHLLIQEG
jgi:hypothetical protein